MTYKTGTPKERRKSQLQARIDYMIFYLGGLCAECGSTHSLEFHHMDPSTKSYNPRARAMLRWQTLVIELDKCQLLCHHCHKAEHATSHGTVTMYNNYKCRCEECKAAMRRYRGHDEMKRAEHGSRTMYKSGCRCDPCRVAQSNYAKSYYHARKQEVRCL